MQRGDVGEVLVRSDAQIHATWFDSLLQLRNDVLEGCLVGNKVVRTEVPARFGKVIDQAPVLGVRKLFWELLWLYLVSTPNVHRGSQHEACNKNSEWNRPAPVHLHA